MTRVLTLYLADALDRGAARLVDAADALTQWRLRRGWLTADEDAACSRAWREVISRARMTRVMRAHGHPGINGPEADA